VDRDFCGWYPSGVMRVLGIILVAILGVGLSADGHGRMMLR
jgi:hypothetical protein